MRLFYLFVGLVFCVGCADKQAFFDQNCDGCDLWGRDNRLEAHELSATYLSDWPLSTVALLHESLLIEGTDGDHFLPLQNTLSYFHENTEEQFCKDVRFTEQPVLPGVCAGAFVASDSILTAYHCLEELGVIEYINGVVDCSRLKVVFDYMYDSDEHLSPRVPSENVFQCESVTWFRYSEGAAGAEIEDMVLLKLRGEVLNRPTFSLSDEKPNVGDDLISLGFPEGLPMKASLGKTRQRVHSDKFLALNSEQGWFSEDDIELVSRQMEQMIHSNLTLFKGNSGGPVIDSRTGKLVGVVSSGSKKRFKVDQPDGTIEYVKIADEDNQYRFNPDPSRACIEALDCENDNVVCDLHTSTDSVTRYKDSLQLHGL